MNQDACILVVDDDIVVLKIITNILQRNGYMTDTCQSGEEALSKIKADEYDLVLLDVQLGTGMDGYHTCKAMHKVIPDLPVILPTANQDDESVNKGFTAGSSDYIKKPVSKLELLARVNKIITLKKAEKNNLKLINDLSKDLVTAANIQEAMLPKWVYLDKEVMFSSYYSPTESVGGDLFDRIRINDDLYVVYIGDISGHGVQAALLMTAIKSIINLMVDNEKDNLNLPWLLTRLNERVCRELFISNTYMTLLMGIIDVQNNVFSYLNAGHPPIIVFDTLQRKASIVESNGSLPLGWIQSLVYTEEDLGSIPLTEHNMFLLYTDGIYECEDNKHVQFGINGLVNVINEHLTLDSCISLPYKIKHYISNKKFKLPEDDFKIFAFQKQRMTLKTVSLDTVNEDKAIHHTFILSAALKEVGKTAMSCEKLILIWTGNSALAAKVELIVDEFLNNIVKYGYKFTENATIMMEFLLKKDKLCIKFWDKGIEWKPGDYDYNIDNPYDFEKDIYNVDGKGVKIIMSMSNKFHRSRYDILNETSVEIDIDR